MKEVDVGIFAREYLERIEAPDGGPGYRCAAILTDGTFLPCVLIASSDSVTNLAVRRFEESRADAKLPAGERRWGTGFEYPEIARNFVARGNRLNHEYIETLQRSRFAIPLERLRDVHGETSMSWTQFAAVMKDGEEFGFGTTFLTEFFDMPEGYGGDDIVEIISHKHVEPVYRERAYFTCYVKGV